MRLMIYIVILVLLLFAPVQRLDVANLMPIQAVAIYQEDDEVVLETDTENKGRGADASEALQSLKKTACAVVYLDTAEYLLVSENAISSVEQLRPYLKPSVKVCVCEAAGSVKDTAKYLEVHADLPELRKWEASEYLLEKSEKR